MAQLIDTFTDAVNTELSTHTADSGGSWAKVSGDNMFIRDNMTYGGGGWKLYTSSDGPADVDNYSMGAVFYIKTAVNHASICVCVVDTNNAIIARCDGANVYLTKRVAGVETVLATSSHGKVATESVTVKLEVLASDLKLYVGGSLVHTEAADGLTRTALVGVSSHFNAASSGIHIDSADTLAIATGPSIT